jgi:glycosyltransferase involved in cell wall biosynthesis
MFVAGGKKRIAFVITSALSLNVLMRGQLEYLRGQGAEIDLYTGGPDAELKKLRSRDVGRVRYVPFHRQPNPLWDLACLVWLTFLLTFRRYDTVVYSTPKAMLLGSLAAFLTAQPRRIAMIRGRGYENFTGAKRRIYIALDKLTFLVSHLVLFISRSTIAAYEADQVDVGRKGLMLGCGSSNGVDLDRFRPLSKTDGLKLRSELGLSADDFVVAVVGRIRDYKGTSEVLELARRLSDIDNLRILLVGPIEQESFRKEIEAAGPVRVRHFAQSPDVEKYFQAANLHLFLTHREGFGNVAIEAAAAGVPTFGFNVVGLADSVIEGVTGRLFTFGDLDSVEAALRSAIADPENLAENYSNAREAIGERFSQPIVWQGYAELFLEEASAPAKRV